MPPPDIAVAEPSTMDNASTEPVRSWWRSRNSSTIDGGNFGAVPKPPLRRSYSGEHRGGRVGERRVVHCGRRERGGLLAQLRDDAPARLPHLRVPRASTPRRRPPSSWRNDGMPGRGAGG